jgi:hypothetical protein
LCAAQEERRSGTREERASGRGGVVATVGARTVHSIKGGRDSDCIRNRTVISVTGVQHRLHITLLLLHTMRL